MFIAVVGFNGNNMNNISTGSRCSVDNFKEAQKWLDIPHVHYLLIKTNKMNY